MRLANVGRAIGAYERTLVTTSPFDRFLDGNVTAMSHAEKQGLIDFVETRCTDCHFSHNVGGQMFNKLGLMDPYETEDTGRYRVSKKDEEKYFFKDPSLLNVAKIGPYLHDGSIAELGEVVRIMGWHQLGKKLDAVRDRPTRVPIGNPTGKAVVDEDSLVRAFKRVERERLAALTADGLLTEAQQAVKKNDLVTARHMLKLLLGRKLQPMERSRGLTELGMLHRRSGNLDGSAQALQDRMDAVGFDCAQGAWAGYQLMWTRKEQGQRARALALADSIAGSTHSNSTVRMGGRWVAATLSHDLGNTARARVDYAAILRDCGDAPEYRHIVEDVRRRMKTL